MTTGAWLDKLVPALELGPTRTLMTWFEPADPDDDSFSLGKFPVFIRAPDQENRIWGHGSADSYGVKVAPDRDENFVAVDPDRIDRHVSARDYALISELVRKALPGPQPDTNPDHHVHGHPKP